MTENKIKMHKCTDTITNHMHRSVTRHSRRSEVERLCCEDGEGDMLLLTCIHVFIKITFFKSSLKTCSTWTEKPYSMRYKIR